MAWCPFAVRDVINGPAGDFTGGPPKVVWHKTQGGSYAGARSAYAKNRSEPHFTVSDKGIWQHVDTAKASRSLKNARGGVQTNRDGVRAIEVVGFSGTTAPPETLANLARLRRWLRDVDRIPYQWPEGRPPKTADEGYGLNNGERHPSTWDSVSGDYGHSQVPENSHWDPAWTDEEWEYLNREMGVVQPAPAPTPAPVHHATVKELDMAKIAADVFPGTTNAAGDVAIVHATGIAPKSAIAGPVAGASQFCDWHAALQNKDGHGVVFRVYSTKTGAVVPNAPVALSYIVVWD